MTTPDLNAIRGRLEKATKGPWEYLSWRSTEGPSEVRGPDGTIAIFVDDEEDGQLIAHARNDLESLVKAVEEKDAAINLLLKYVQHHSWCRRESTGVCECGLWPIIEKLQESDDTQPTQRKEK